MTLQNSNVTNKIDFDFSDSDSEVEEQQVGQPFSGKKNTWVGTLTLCAYEKFNKDKLNFILKNKYKYLPLLQDENEQSVDDYNPFKKPSEYLMLSRDGIFKATYRKSSNAVDNMGRLFASEGLSLQNFSREIRHTIASDYYDDIDMVNAHPVFLRHLCVKHDIEHPYLQQYIEDRDKVIADLIKENPETTRDKIKKCILSIINGGDKDYKEIENKTKWLKKFKREMENIKTDLEDAYSTFFKKVAVVCEKNGKTRAQDSALNILFCDIENKALMYLCEFLENEGVLGNHFVLCFDGIMIQKDISPENNRTALVDNAKKYISEKMGFEIQLKIKPMTEGFDLPDDIEPFNEVIGITASDPYTWLDFDEQYRGALFESIDDCICSTLYDLRRVFARVEGGTGFIIKKTNCDDKIHELISAKEKHTDLYFRYQHQGEKGKITIKELKFDQYSKYGAKKMKQYSTIDFAPGSTDGRIFNLFTGYKAQLLESYNPKKFKRIFKHVKEVVCNGDEAKLKYFMTWLAHVLERPGDRTGVVVFLHSEEQGTGKNTVFDFLANHVIGNNYTREVIGLQPLLEKHNTVLMGRKFLVVNEARDTGNTFSANFDKLKSLITDSTVFIDPKGKDGITIKNHLEIVVSSQHYNSIKIEETDRRYFCMTVNDLRLNDKAYFDKLYKSFTDEAGDHFFTYVIKEFGGKRVGKPPMTPLKQNMIEISLPSPYRFLKSKPWNILENDGATPQSLKVNPTQLYDMYEEWCKKQREPNIYKLKAFEMKVAKRLSKVKVVENRKIKYDLSFL